MVGVELVNTISVCVCVESTVVGKSGFLVEWLQVLILSCKVVRLFGCLVFLEEFYVCVYVC